ncbi:hypothetical protein C8R47DRAFT_509884 [Mycena vitilis]|nr:hypothetical protein C8R47DRAFT_509884 [Mycena vitilis]
MPILLIWVASTAASAPDPARPRVKLCKRCRWTLGKKLEWEFTKVADIDGASLSKFKGLVWTSKLEFKLVLLGKYSGECTTRKPVAPPCGDSEHCLGWTAPSLGSFPGNGHRGSQSYL